MRCEACDRPTWVTLIPTKHSRYRLQAGSSLSIPPITADHLPTSRLLGLVSASTCMRHTIMQKSKKILSPPIPTPPICPAPHPPPHPGPCMLRSAVLVNFSIALLLSYLAPSTLVLQIARGRNKNVQGRSLCMLLDNPAFASVCACNSCTLRSFHLSCAVAMFRNIFRIENRPKSLHQLCACPSS